MDVAVHGGDDDAALAVAGLFFQVLLEVADGALHHLGALQHEWQNELTRAKPIADVLHGRQQHVIEHRHRRGGPRERTPLRDRLVEERLDAFFLAMEDAIVDPLVDGEIGLGVL